MRWRCAYFIVILLAIDLATLQQALALTNIDSKLVVDSKLATLADSKPLPASLYVQYRYAGTAYFGLTGNDPLLRVLKSPPLLLRLPDPFASAFDPTRSGVPDAPGFPFGFAENVPRRFPLGAATGPLAAIG